MAKKKQHDSDRLPPNGYDPKMALSVADSFYTAAERCNEQEYIGDHFIWLPVPAIVNYALSCEIYMKALLMKPGAKENKVHNLLDLFNILPSDIQTDIQQTIDCSKSPFLEMLKNTSDLFEECRYVYEYKSLHINLKFLQELTASLKTASHKKIISEFIAQTSPLQSDLHPGQGQ